MAAISINRAGKVRAQTPKTPKMEKARKKTGRAALRIKFARRSETDYFAAKGKVRLNKNVVRE